MPTRRHSPAAEERSRERGRATSGLLDGRLSWRRLDIARVAQDVSTGWSFDRLTQQLVEKFVILGRESRSIKTCAIADNLGGIPFPHAHLAFRVHRRRKPTGRTETRENVYAVISLAAHQTRPTDLAIGTLKILGADNIAKTTRAIRHEPERALAILGITNNPDTQGLDQALPHKTPADAVGALCCAQVIQYRSGPDHTHTRSRVPDDLDYWRRAAPGY